jgi:sulfatase maturation enzyme AslB (radical SAM superfamily)
MLNRISRKAFQIKRTLERAVIDKASVSIIFYLRMLSRLLKRPPITRKNINHLKIFYSQNKSSVISHVPAIFNVHIASGCNLRCPNCVYLLKDSEVFGTAGMMSTEMFESIIKKYYQHIEVVFLSGGEPLGHPKFQHLVDIVHKYNKNIIINTSTNGVFLEKKIETVKQLSSINLSLDSYDYYTFKKYRGGTPKEFDKIIRGMALMKENSIRFQTSFLLSEENISEAEKMVEFAAKTGSSRVIFHNINTRGSDKFTVLMCNSQKVTSWIEQFTARTDYQIDIELPVIFDPDSRSIDTYSCSQPWTYFIFNDKGHVAYCCHLAPDESIGNVLEGYDFNSEKMVEMRRSMLDHTYKKSDCQYCQRRFLGLSYGYFSASYGKWVINTN